MQNNSTDTVNGTSFIDEIMGIDPTSLEVFQEKPSSSARNANVYKASPSLSKAEDGHYRCKLRVIFNPYNVKRSIVPCLTYSMTDANGFFLVKSKLGEGDRDCEIFKSWKKLWFSGDDTKKEWAKKMYERSESQWCLVQVLEDVNQPEMVGQIKVMKLPKAIFTKMSAKMNPSAESKKEPISVMDYLIGLPLEMDVQPGPDDPKQPQRKFREISYDLCEFDADYAPIVKVDGTPLFTDEELEIIDAFDAAKKKVAKAKTEKAKADAQKEVDNLKESIRTLYQKALDYLKNEAHIVDLDKECAYQPWDQHTTDRVNRWIDNVLNMRDPKVVDINEVTTNEVPLEEAAANTAVEMSASVDDVPF